MYDRNCPAIGNAIASMRASQPSHSPLTTSAAIISAAAAVPTGTGGTSGAIAGRINTVSAIARPARTMAGGSASPRPGSNMIAAPVRARTSTKAKAQPGNAASSAASAWLMKCRP